MPIYLIIHEIENNKSKLIILSKMSQKDTQQWKK